MALWSSSRGSTTTDLTSWKPAEAAEQACYPSLSPGTGHQRGANCSSLVRTGRRLSTRLLSDQPWAPGGPLAAGGTHNRTVRSTLALASTELSGEKVTAVTAPW